MRYSEFRMKYTGDLKIGDIVRRIIRDDMDARIAQRDGEFGIVVDRYMSGSPIHPCVEVMWPNGKGAIIGEVYLERISEEEYDKAG